MENKGPIRLIGIAGSAGAGKDQVAQYIKEILWGEDWEIKRFSRGLAYIAAVLTNISEDQFSKRSFKNKKNKEWGMTGREMLQKIGTDALRNNFHPDVWVRFLFSRAMIDRIKWILPDLRFKNEFEAIKARGGICIRVDRPGLKEKDLHVSEQEWRDLDFDYVIDNSGNLMELYRKVFLLLEKIELLKNKQINLK